MEEYEGGFTATAPKREYTGVKTLRCISAKQIASIDVEESSSINLVDNAEISNIIVCGYIKSVKKTSAGYIFTIDDTTSVLECAFWANGGYDEIISERIQENNLVKVIGSLKVFNHKKALNISSIVMIDSNALIYHLTNCIYQHLFYTNRLDRTDAIQKPSSAGGLGKIQKDILDVYRNNQDDNGLEMDVVISMLRGKYPEHEIRDVIDNLLTDCHLYSVDGTSYRTTC